jgi:predicted HicB family RNase H-like nuclease
LSPARKPGVTSKNYVRKKAGTIRLFKTLFMKEFTYNADPEVQKLAQEKAKSKGSNLNVVIRQFLARYIKNFKEE